MSIKKISKREKIGRELNEAMPMGVSAGFHGNPLAKEGGLNAVVGAIQDGLKREAGAAGGGGDVQGVGFLPPSNFVGRTPLLYVDPMFDPILFLFPKDRIDEINKRLRHYYETDPIVGNAIDLHSLPAGELVFCNDGVKEIQNIQIGDLVLGRSGAFTKVVRRFEHPHDGDVFRLKAMYLPPVQVTDTHPVLAIPKSAILVDNHGTPVKTADNAPSHSKAKWFMAKDIRKGDVVMFPKFKVERESEPIDIASYIVGRQRAFYAWDDREIVTVKSSAIHNRIPRRVSMSEDFAELLGWYVAEGSCVGSTIDFTLGTHEQHSIVRIAALVKNIFGLDASAYEKENNSTHVTFFSAPLARMLSDICGKGALNKKIPEQVLFGSPNVAKSFLSAYLLGDGCLGFANKSMPSGRPFSNVVCNTVSRTLARQLLLLGSKCGVIFGTGSGSQKLSPNTLYWLSAPKRVIWPLLYGKECPPPKSGRVMEYYQQDDAYFYVRITDVESYKFCGTVYDVETEEHSFCAPFVIHNSQLPLSDFYLQCEDKEIERYWNDFKDRSGLLDFLQKLLHDYWLLGEGIGLPVWDPHNFEWSHFNQYPPENVDIFRTYVTPTAFFLLKPDPDLQKKVNSGSEMDQAQIRLMPTAYVDSLKDGKPYLLGSDKKVIYLARQTTKYRHRGVSVLSRCFVPGTPITLADGTSKPVEEMRIGDRVITHKGRARSVTDTPTYDVDEDICVVSIEGERELLRMTGDHGCFVYEAPECVCGCAGKLDEQAISLGRNAISGHARVWTHGAGSTAIAQRVSTGSIVRKNADQLGVGDWLVTKLGPGDDIIQPPADMTPGKARLIGYFLAEGFYRKNCHGFRIGLNFCFGEHEEHTWVKDVQDLMASEFGEKTRLDYARKNHGITVAANKNDDVIRWFHRHCGEYAATKILPGDVMRWPVELQREIIRGFFRGDGHHHGRNLSASCISKKLMEQMRLMVLRCGWPCYFSSKMYEEGNNRRPLYTISIPGRCSGEAIKFIFGEDAYSGCPDEDFIVSEVRRMRDVDKVPYYKIAEEFNSKPDVYKPRGKKFYAAGIQAIYERGMYLGKGAGKLHPQMIRDGHWLRRVEAVDHEKYLGNVHCITVDEDHSLQVSGCLYTNCLKDLLYKDKLRLLQLTFVDRHMYPIKIFKLGSESRGWIPNKKHFNRLQQLLVQASNDPDFCFDEKTQLLTENGWKGIGEFVDGEKLASFNPKNNEIEYHAPLDWNVSDYDGDMYHFRSNSIDALVTPNHKMWVRPEDKASDGKDLPWRFVKAKNLRGSYKFRATADWVGTLELEDFGGPKLEDAVTGESNAGDLVIVTKTAKSVRFGTGLIELNDILRLAGWYISEGCGWRARGYTTKPIRVHISQNEDSDLTPDMDALCSRLPFKVSRYGRKAASGNPHVAWGMYEQDVNKFLVDNFGIGSANKKIPKWVLMLPAEQQRILVEAMMQGDGTDLIKGGIHLRTYYTSSPHLVDALQEIALKIGWTSSFRELPIMNGRTMPHYHVLLQDPSDRKRPRKAFPLLRKKHISKVHYSGKIFCPTVPPHHLVVARRNGKIMISGQSILYHFGLQVEYVGTKDKIANLIPEFEWVERQCMAALFVNDEIIHGGVPSAVRDTVNLRTLMHRYLGVREMIEKAMVQQVFLPIAQARGFYRKAFVNQISRESSKIEKHIVKIAGKDEEIDVIWQDKKAGLYTIPFNRTASIDLSMYDLPRPIWKKMNLINNLAEQQLFMKMEEQGKLPLEMLFDMFGIDKRMVDKKMNDQASTLADPLWRKIKDDIGNDKRIRIQILKGLKPDQWALPADEHLDETPEAPKAPAKKPEAPVPSATPGAPKPPPKPAPKPAPGGAGGTPPSSAPKPSTSVTPVAPVNETAPMEPTSPAPPEAA